MRILWLSNSGRMPTGYGNQTAVFLPKLKAAGHEVALFAFCGVEGAPLIDSHGILTLPRLRDPYGNDIVEGHYAYHQADALISLIDPFVLAPEVYARLTWIAWAPIDSEPLLPDNAAVLRSARRVWAMSRFGESQLRAAGFTNIDYVPHGVDSQTFRPIDKAEALARLKHDAGIDLADRFVVCMNSANKGTPSRKGFFEAFAAFKVFSDAHPDAVLYVHTEKLGIWHGEPLPLVAQMVGLHPDRVIFAPYYHYVTGLLPPSFLNDVYNAADVFLTTSHGEGFGIPIVESQMAGCPVIVTDFSAMSELCFAGWRVPGVPFMHAPGATQRLPLLPEVIRALDLAHRQRGDLRLRDEARRGALGYDAEAVFQRYLRPALENLIPRPPLSMSEREPAGEVGGVPCTSAS
jgi:glycosyltransferase involved in cell wall biosynthesis